MEVGGRNRRERSHHITGKGSDQKKKQNQRTQDKIQGFTYFLMMILDRDQLKTIRITKTEHGDTEAGDEDEGVKRK